MNRPAGGRGSAAHAIASAFCPFQKHLHDGNCENTSNVVKVSERSVTLVGRCGVSLAEGHVVPTAAICNVSQLSGPHSTSFLVSYGAGHSCKFGVCLKEYGA